MHISYNGNLNTKQKLKSNVKLHELEVYSEHVASSYILIYKSLSAFSFSLVSYLAI